MGHKYVGRRKCPWGKFTNYKQRGEWVELLFMTLAAQRRFNVARPWGDSARYDVCIEKNGRFRRVQIKSTIHWTGGAYHCLLKAAHQTPYTLADLDYFAIYIVPDNVWYIFPAQKLIGLTAVILTPHRRTSKHARYKNAWDLLEPHSARTTPASKQTDAKAQ